jgi:hypothetical protein
MRNITRYSFILLLTIASCTKKTDDNGSHLGATSQDSLALIPIDFDMKFVSINANDQVALLFKRESRDTFKYRIELLRKWKGLPLDHGIVHLQKVEADTIYAFAGGNSDCEVLIKIYKNNGKFGHGSFARLERNCKVDSMDIARDEFPKLWSK